MLKENDTFYYVSERFYTKDNIEHKEYCVYAYQFHGKFDDLFKHHLMFKNEEDAKRKALELNTKKGY